MLPIQEMKLPALPTPPPEDQMILMSMALVYLLSLPLVLVYFLHITLSSLKNSSMKKRTNNQQWTNNQQPSTKAPTTTTKGPTTKGPTTNNHQ